MRIWAIAALAAGILLHGLLGALHHERRERNIQQILHDREVVPYRVAP